MERKSPFRLELEEAVSGYHTINHPLYVKWSQGELSKACMMGTDAGTQLTDHGDNALELKYLVEAGVRPADALVAATGNAADLSRFTNRGRVSDGLCADLLIVDGNPVDDITMVAHRQNHRAVIKNGVVVAGSMTSNVPAK
jgi:imidazolonepropionase-like amidohydrolase